MISMIFICFQKYLPSPLCTSNFLSELKWYFTNSITHSPLTSEIRGLKPWNWPWVVKLVVASSLPGADFTKGLSTVSDSNLRLLSQIIGIFFLIPWAQPLWISQMAQMLRLVESGLKFCKQRLKYGRHNCFSTLKFEMSENKVEMHKTKYWSSVWVVLHVYKVSHWKTAFDQRYYVPNKIHICHQ